MSDLPPLQPAPGQFTPPPPKKGGLPGWLIAVIAALAGLVVLCVIGAIVAIGTLNMLGSQVSDVFTEISSELEPAAESEATALPVDTSQAQGIGQRARADQLEITVTGASQLIAATELPPESGMVYYRVDLAVQNTSDTAAVLSAFSSRIQDESDGVYEVSLFGQSSAGAASDELFQMVEAGASVDVTFVYEVPQAANSLFWVFESGAGDAVVFQIK